MGETQALVNAGITFAFTDVAWGLSCIYLSIALAYNSEGKPPQVYVTLILGAALVFVALASSIGEFANSFVIRLRRVQY